MRPDNSGILLIDKPTGISSARAVAIVKRATRSKKAGHAGTLDPMATGLLICCLNQGTKLARFLLFGEKQYEAVLRLGSTTDTQDATGKTLDRKEIGQISRSDIETGLGQFIGSIQQQPPVYSAVKHRGKPLYHYARNGTPVTKPPRTVTIKALTLQKMDLPDVYFRVTCSAGTYVRTLCADLGDLLGCGGHLAALRRTACCGFSVEDALTLEQIETLADEGVWRDRLVSPNDVLADLPSHQAIKTLGEKIRYGRPLSSADGVKATGQDMKIVDANKKLLAVIDNEYNYVCVFPDGV